MSHEPNKQWTGQLIVVPNRSRSGEELGSLSALHSCQVEGQCIQFINQKTNGGRQATVDNRLQLSVPHSLGQQPHMNFDSMRPRREVAVINGGFARERSDRGRRIACHRESNRGHLESRHSPAIITLEFGLNGKTAANV